MPSRRKMPRVRSMQLLSLPGRAQSRSPGLFYILPGVIWRCDSLGYLLPFRSAKGKWNEHLYEYILYFLSISFGECAFFGKHRTAALYQSRFLIL